MNLNDAIKLAYKLQNDGQLDQAEFLYHEILKIQPSNVSVYYNLGVICQDKQRLDEALYYYKEALQLNANLTDAYFNIGAILYSKNLYDDAISYYKKALKLEPNSTDINNNLGSALKAKGKLNEAILHFQRALDLDPHYDSGYNNLGLAFKDKGQLNEAIHYFEKALQINPHFMNARNNLAIANLNVGIAFHDKGNPDKAIPYYQKALENNPHFSEAYYSLGNYYRDKGFLSEAITHYRKCLDLNPDYVEAYNNLGIIYRDLGQLNEAEETFRNAIRVNPYSYAFSNLLFTMLSNPRHDLKTIYLEHLNFSRQCAEHFAPADAFYANIRDPDRRLKIGYVSPDFRRHSVAYFFEPVLREHSSESCEIFCYSMVSVPDEFTRRMQQRADHWCNLIGMSDEKAAELIRKDEIDILIDLAGHTAHNRMLLFARKPAPIQVSWIGYPATTGLSTIDYKIVDNFTDPPGTTEQFYSEKLLRLPNSFICYLPDENSPQVGPSPVSTAGHITFGSFNIFAKVTSEVCAVWAKILDRLPDSRLILKDRNFQDKTTCAYAINMLRQRGIPVKRVLLQPWDSPPKHLNAYNMVDIGLDTFPFNGLTTTCEAMWMGVPVITLAGGAYAARAGVSLLSSIGLPELIAKTKDEYIAIAVNLASDIDKLQLLRKSLREKMERSPLTNAKLFTAHLENCYRTIWQDWCNAMKR